MIKLKSLLESVWDSELNLKAKALERELEMAYPQIQDLDIYISSNGSLFINSIRIKKEKRHKGIGREVMTKIIKFADEHGLVITLAPEAEAKYKAKLEKFYKSLGFKNNKGRNSDQRLSVLFSKSMLRRPLKEAFRLQSISLINDAVKKDLAAAAQKVYDEWNQDAEGHDEELGYGGICQDIAEELANVLYKHGIHDVQTVSSCHEQHVYLIGRFREGIFMIDIPYSYYETGGGFTWKKRPGVVFDGSHIEISPLDRNPRNLKKYTDEM